MGSIASSYWEGRANEESALEERRELAIDAKLLEVAKRRLALLESLVREVNVGPRTPGSLDGMISDRLSGALILLRARVS